MCSTDWDDQISHHVQEYGEEPPAAAREFFELSNYIEAHRDELISFEILPSVQRTHAGCSCLLIDGAAVAIGKKDLVKAFIYARAAFFGHGIDAFAKRCSSQDLTPEKAKAARVMLLFDPEHVTASNYLKKQLVSSAQDDANTVNKDHLFLQSVLTSPLHKHSKSPTLWYHRFWLVSTFAPWERNVLENGVPERKFTTAYKRAEFWRNEYRVAIRAAEQHEKNVYAFQYLRRLWELLWQDPEVYNYNLRADVVGSETIRRLAQWCRQHPTDISAWTFLVWLCCRPQAGHNMKILAQSQIRAIEMFQEKLDWSGASVKFALASMKELAPTYFPNKPICALRVGTRTVQDAPNQHNGTQPDSTKGFTKAQAQDNGQLHEVIGDPT